jgi:hypothetical protein
MLLMFFIFGVVTLLSEKTRLGIVLFLNFSWLKSFTNTQVYYCVIKTNKFFPI